jgi:hypothetical protein
MSTLIEALNTVAHLPERARVLIGRGPDVRALDWQVADARDPFLFSRLPDPDPELEAELTERAAEFLDGEAQVSVTLRSRADGALLFVILGASSAEQLGERLMRAAHEIASQFVSSYLAQKQQVWRAPMAKVLPFTPRPKPVQPNESRP